MVGNILCQQKWKAISKRSHWFESQGYETLRFWDNEVLTNIQGVLEVIGTHCLNHPPLNPLPSREGK